MDLPLRADEPDADPLPYLDGVDAASALPAFAIDVTAGVLLAANAAGLRAWGLAIAGAEAPIALDRAMPALLRLRREGWSADGESTDGEELTFWTARGVLCLRCRLAPIDAAAGRVLVRALPEAGRVLQAAVGRNADSALGADDAGEALTPAPALLAHEVRTPLSAAIAYAEVLKDEHFGPMGNARYREYARNIYDSARHALSVVDGMLAGDSAAKGGAECLPERLPDRLPELDFRDLDPVGVIDNCLAVARPLAERAGLDLLASAGTAMPRVIADEVSLKQMLLNLITNAIKFGRPGDRITLGAAYGDDGRLRIEVADTGPGMEPSAFSSRPAPVQEAPAVRATGLGIGLPLTRALAEANGAALIVDSAPGCGTRVTIAFAKDRVVPV